MIEPFEDIHLAPHTCFVPLDLLFRYHLERYFLRHGTCRRLSPVLVQEMERGHQVVVFLGAFKDGLGIL